MAIEDIKNDFDRIAMLAGGKWDHNRHYHNYLLKHIPARCEHALEIGCGAGEFTRILAGRSERVIALDVSPKMIEVARRASAQFPNIEYILVDATQWNFPCGHFDCVASIATMHHLPFEDILTKMRDSLKPGGVMVILDLFQPKGFYGLLKSALAALANFVLRLIYTGKLFDPRDARMAWREHKKHEKIMTLTDIRKICASILSTAKIKERLLWRYSIIWKKAGNA